MLSSNVAQRRPPAPDGEGGPPRRPRLVPPLEPVPLPKRRRRDVALDVQGSLAIPETPFPWERELLAEYLAALLDEHGPDDEPGSGA